MNVIKHTGSCIICEKNGQLFNIPRALAQINCLFREAAVWQKCDVGYTVCVFDRALRASAPNGIYAFICFTPVDDNNNATTIPNWMQLDRKPQIFMQFGDTMCISKGAENRKCTIPIDIHKASMNAEAEINNGIQSRLEQIQSDTRDAAENINAYETIEGYTKLRVKRAFLCLNEHTIDKRLNDIEQVVSKLRELVVGVSPLFESTFSTPEDAHVGDIYTPCATDYSLV